MKKVNNPKPCPGFLITWVALLLAMAASESWPVFPCGPAEKKVRLTIFHPSVGIIQELTKLREERLLDVSHLAVLGVYHQNERTDYYAVRKYVESNRLDWLTFNPISAPLSPESLFQKNACSGEFSKLFEQSDGIIFFGGQDIPPRLYGEKMRLLTEVEDPYRHYLELSFIFHLLGGTQDLSFKPLLERRRNLAVFGICLGCESLNVGTGGTLTQDIWSEIYGVPYLEDAVALGKERWHTNPLYRLYPAVGLFSNVLHPIKLSEKGMFCAVWGLSKNDQPYVYSAHHQQIEKLGHGLRVIATSLDGKVVEAVEHDRYRNVLGVQFHPEAGDLFDTTFRTRFTPDDPAPSSLLSFLKSHPPSSAFHQKIWAWLSRALVD